ncbi:MAG TPA: hypothetical protein DCL77_01940 [Prolixibacteraceae bacterium]|jgi:hypothetical protein|nr:hypothetical protein [Prolixibacteraceae bacterium]
MKTKYVLTAFLSMTFMINFSYAQVGNCKVLKPEIALSYSGDCKKGLADGKGAAEGKDKYVGKFKDGLPHGNGTYQYANGDVYEGDFKNGMKNGTGKFTFKYMGKDSTYLGNWKEDKLVKKIVPPAYTITQSFNVQRYNVRKVKSGNRIMFAFMQNGKTNLSVSSLSFAESDGSSISLGQERGFDNIRFPFTCKVTYNSLNSFQSATFQNIFEIQITEPGQWLITLYN